jgi:Flp pilus assembly protein TadG
VKIAPASDLDKKQRGSAMIEMAVILPIYLSLVIDTIQLCLIIFGYCNATYASREAARYAAVHGTGSTYQCTSTDLSNIATQYLWGVPKNAVTISSSWSPDNNPGSSVTVKISVTYPAALPFSTLTRIAVGTSATDTILQ